MKLLLKKLPREIPMCHVYVPVFIPLLGSISRDVITKILHKGSIKGISFGQCMLWVRHLHGEVSTCVGPFGQAAVMLEVKIVTRQFRCLDKRCRLFIEYSCEALGEVSAVVQSSE